jgi:hypothetical protein
MSKSEQIRQLAREGNSTADIARQLGIRYQHAYKVLADSKQLRTLSRRRADEKLPPKLLLTTAELEKCGFVLSASWLLSSEGTLVSSAPFPRDIGVYAFAQMGHVLYVGVATMGLAKRLYFYANPGRTQRTSQRIHDALLNELQAAPAVEIYTATPADLEWNGLPIHGAAGLEMGLIRRYTLPWNIRSARR